MKKTKTYFLVAGLLMCSATTYANSITPHTVEAFVTTAQKDNIVDVSQHSKGLNVIIVDSTNVMDAKLSASLPLYDQARFGTSQNYQKQMIKKVKRWTEENKNQLKNAFKDVSKAVSYQLNAVPAIVIDQQYVVYGDTVSSAVNKWREAIKSGGVNK